MPKEAPRFALVVWPYNRIGIVTLEGVERAVQRGALIIAREDADMFAVAADEDTDGQ